MNADTWLQGGLALVGSLGAVVAARAARRTKRQENRDDFTTFVAEIRKSLKDVRAELADQKAEAGELRRRSGQQDAALAWLLDRVRGLTSYIRRQGMEPPAPDPIPPAAREYIHNLDV